MTPILSGVNLNIQCINLYQNRREIAINCIVAQLLAWSNKDKQRIVLTVSLGHFSCTDECNKCNKQESCETTSTD